MKYVFRKRRYIVLAVLLDAFGYFLFRLFGACKSIQEKAPRNILVIRMDHLGDVLMATSVPKLIKDSLPGSRVTFLTSSWGAALLENNPFVDEVMLYDAPWFSKKRYQGSGKGLSFSKLVKSLKERNFDLAIGLRGDLRENFLLFLAGIKERVGYGITGGGFFLTKEIDYKHFAHESERTLDLLRVLGIRKSSLAPELYFSKDEDTLLDQKVPEIGRSKKEKYIGYQIDAGAGSKEWPLESATAFMNNVVGQFPDYRIVLVGSNSEKSRLLRQPFGLPRNDTQARDEGKIIDLVGKTTIRDLCVLSRRFSAFVGPDSGPTHIAAALGVPTIFLYSGTNDFERWKPLSENAFVLKHPTGCAPCYLDTCNVKGHPCMSGIKPDRVMKVLELALEGA